MIDLDKATQIEQTQSGTGTVIECRLQLRTAQRVDFSYGVPQELIEKNLKRRIVSEIYGDIIHDIQVLKYEHLQDIPYLSDSYNTIEDKFDKILSKLKYEDKGL